MINEGIKKKQKNKINLQINKISKSNSMTFKNNELNFNIAFF